MKLRSGRVVSGASSRVSEASSRVVSESKSSRVVARKKPEPKILVTADLDRATERNTDYRRVLHTTPDRRSQLVLMSLKPGEEIGMEVHPKNDQFIKIESGRGRVTGGKGFRPLNLRAGSEVTIPAGAHHNIINTSKTAPLKLYTEYSPANHPAGTVQHVKPARD